MKTDMELVKEYREGNESIIRKIYKANLPLFTSIGNKYYEIDPATKESICLVEIWKCLNNYNPEKNCKLTTMISTYYKNALRTEREALRVDKRKVNLIDNCSNFTEILNDDSEDDNSLDRLDCISSSDSDSYNTIEVIDLIKKLHLSKNQEKFCMIVVKQSCEPGIVAIARALGLTKQGAIGVRKQLRVILEKYNEGEM